MNWMTPDCSDRRSKNSKQQGLSNQVWLTPRADEPCEKHGAVAKRLGDRGEHCHGSLSGQIADGKSVSAKLNPAWVEQLMDLPVGWTQLSGYGKKSNRIDRLRLLGNGVVRATAAKALTTLLGRFENDRL